MDVIAFGTAALRNRVTEAWAAAASRFREDANAEEDAALGAYRDRLIVELLQNAVDAASAAGVPAKVLIRLSPPAAGTGPGGLLEVANTGAPLTAAGVEALSTLRASAKRDVQAVGRFGAGFAAVLAVTDTPSIVSRTSPLGGYGTAGGRDGADGWWGVGWSRQRTAELVRASGVDALLAELDRRGGAVPVLRLPFDLDDPRPGPAGYDTVIRLPLRDEAAAATARALIAELDPTLPVVLRGLAEIIVEVDGEVRRHHCEWEPTRPGPDGTSLEVATVGGVRWQGCVRRGTIPPELLADRPVEERGRTGYTARAMVPDGDWPDQVMRVIRAPQPTDEPISIPALLSVDLP
ncbi:sacsin N-terminal ATP-binding-like domain-containing protein, partial [Frankia sp. EI5c]|uniref:sacsin N-terminal ATP-binding-like domain-containing protein n=2 Tax=Frankia sp. EI5c TaxID=683316 RepID=UPI0037C1B013